SALGATKPSLREALRAFQGWRYLKPDDAPKDLKAGSGTIEMPANLRAELREAMVW
ncbi:MAG: DUF1489 family protein, partial [Pseudomonadota bacterium]